MHNEYKYINPHADTAILFIHGIVGTPNHFHNFVPLVPDNISVYNMLLDGHGKGVKDFSKTSMEKWEQQVALAIDALATTHKEIYIVAHSLGCLLALEQSVNKPIITKMFLLAVPTKLFLKPKMFFNSLKVYLDKINPSNEELIAAKQCYGIAQNASLFLYLGWIPRFLELFSKIRKIRKSINTFTVPCSVYQSTKDEMVSKKATDVLKKNPTFSVVELKNSGHYYYSKTDLPILKEAFMDFICQT